MQLHRLHHLKETSLLPSLQLTPLQTPHSLWTHLPPPGLIQTQVRNVKWSSRISSPFYTSFQLPDIFYLGKKKTRTLIHRVSSHMQSLHMEVWPHGQYQLQRHKDSWLVSHFPLDHISLLIMGIHKGKPFSYPTLWTALKVSGAEIDLPYDVPGGMASFQQVSYSRF